MISINFKEDNKKVLVIGGGKQALQKGMKFPNCTYLSPSFIDEVPEENRVLKVYEKDDITGYFLVIAATNNKDLNHQIVLDCNEKNILSASINMDEDASVHFQKEMDFPYFHIAFTTKSTCPGYHEKLEEEFTALYQRHEPVLIDLSYIREYVVENIQKYSVRNELLISIVQKDKEFIHTLKRAIDEKSCKVLCFHSNRNEKNVEILNSFVAELSGPCFYCFNHELEEVQDILSNFDITCDIITITLRNGNANKQISEQASNSRTIYFTDAELSKMMRNNHYDYYIYHPIQNDTLKSRLARSYIVYDFNDHPVINPGLACICLLLKGAHYHKEIQAMIQNNPHIEFDTKCLLEQDFFKEMLKEKIG